MSHQPPPPQTSNTVPPVWPDLPSDLQQRAVRLLAQLAYAQFRQHSSLATLEIDHDPATQQFQGSSRSS